jgi:DNA-binding MarR family transcriptional regulator
LRLQLSTRKEELALASKKGAAVLRLNRFVPFRLNRLASAVSEHLAEIYRDRFGLDIPEWRVLVTVGGGRPCTAQYIAASTRMHKTRVSRAVATLMQRGLLERTASHSDAREMPLLPTAAGRRMYRQLEPLALARERSLLACLDRAQLATFLSALDRLEESLGLSREDEAT